MGLHDNGRFDPFRSFDDRKAYGVTYSIVVPVHNESTNLESFIREFVGEIPEEVRELLLEIVLVENGSTDDTLGACKKLERLFPDLVRTISADRPSYGEAIKLGICDSRGTHLSILECDFLDVEFLQHSVQCFRDGKGRFIVGSKRHPMSSDERPFKRRLLTVVLNQMLRVIFGYPGTDTRGLKSMETKLGQELCKLAVTTDEVLQTELVLLAWHQGEVIQELPIHVKEVRPAPVTVAKRSLMFIEFVLSLRKSMKRLKG